MNLIVFIFHRNIKEIIERNEVKDSIGIEAVFNINLKHGINSKMRIQFDYNMGFVVVYLEKIPFRENNNSNSYSNDRDKEEVPKILQYLFAISEEKSKEGKFIP